MKKVVIILLIVFAFRKSFAQGTGYALPLPEGWKSETIPFPIDFAPSISYQGIEELRFTPDWGNAGTNDYWSYTFLWFVDGTPQVNANVLNTYLTAYFDGLYHSNNKSLPDSTGFTKADLITATTASGDDQTYSGKISTMNYLTKKKIQLYINIHVQPHTDAKETAIFFELSPKPYSNPVWGELDSIVNGFQLQQ